MNYILRILYLALGMLYIDANANVGKTKTPSYVSEFKQLAPKNRIALLWSIFDETTVSGSLQAGFLNKTDSLAALATKVHDENFFWHCQYLRRLYQLKADISMAKDPVSNMEKLKGWIANCPVQAIRISYQFEKGRLFFDKLDYIKGFENMLLAMERFKEAGYSNIPEFSRYIALLQKCFFDFGDFNSVIAYGKLINEQPLNDKNAIKSVYLTGQAYLSMRELDSADISLKKALALAAGNGYQELSATIAESIGKKFLTTKDYNSAIPYLISSLLLFRNNQMATLELAYCYLEANKVDSAEYYFKYLNTPAKEATDGNYIALYYKYLAIKYYLKNDYVNAYAAMEDLGKITDSIYDKRTALITSSSETRFNKQLELFQRSLKRKDNVYQNKVWIFSSSAILLITVCVAINYYKSNKMLRTEGKENDRKEALLRNEHELLKQEVSIARQTLARYIEQSRENGIKEKYYNEYEYKQEESLAEDKMHAAESFIGQVLLTEQDWHSFKEHLTSHYPGFYDNLNRLCQNLTSYEINLLSMIKLRLQNKEMAVMTGISDKSISKAKYRLKKKLEDLNIMDDELETFVERL